MARGGKRTPGNPAAVSGPGALSARTDGGATEISDATGHVYGQEKALAAVEGGGGAGPSAVGGGTGSSISDGAAGSAATPDVFGPTDRPTEPLTAGSVIPGDQPALSTDAVLRLLYQKHPTPWLARMLRD